MRRKYPVIVASDELAVFMQTLLTHKYTRVTVRTDWDDKVYFVFKLSRKDFERYATKSTLRKFAS